MKSAYWPAAWVYVEISIVWGGGSDFFFVNLHKTFHYFLKRGFFFLYVHLHIYLFSVNCTVIDLYFSPHSVFFNHYVHLCILHLFCLSAVPMADNKFIITTQSFTYITILFVTCRLLCMLSFIVHSKSFQIIFKYPKSNH